MQFAGVRVCASCIVLAVLLCCGAVAFAQEPGALLDVDWILAQSENTEAAQSDPAKDFSLSDLAEDEYFGAESMQEFDIGDMAGDEPVMDASPKSTEKDVPPNALTLYEACRLALVKHPLVASARAMKMESDADYGIARSVYLPRIDLQSQLGPSKNLDNGQVTYGEGSLIVSQKLFDFGGMQNGVESAKLRAQSASLRFARTREDIAALVINSYLTILEARELLQVYETSQDFYEKLLATFWARYNAGISSRADAQKVEVSLRTTESQLTIQNQQLKTAKLLLENIIKEKVDSIDPNVDLSKVNVAGTLEESFDVAKANNVGLRAYQAEIESQRKAIASRRAEYLPSIGYRLRARNEFMDFTGSQSTGEAQLTFDWNIFDGFATVEKVKKEEAALLRMIATMEATELDILNVLSDAFNAYESSAQEYRLAEEAHDSSLYLMGLYLSEFDLGIRTLLDLITAREGQTSAAVREVNARYSRLRAVLNIVLEEGRLSEVLKLPLDDSL